MIDEIRKSLDVRIALKQIDFYWVEGELLRLRQKVFLEVLKRVVQENQGEVVKRRSGVWIGVGEE